MLAVISIVVIALGLMLGRWSGGQATAKLGGLVLALILAPFGWLLLKSLVTGLPLALDLLLLLAAPLLLLFGTIRMLFGRGVWEHLMGHFLYDLLHGMTRFCGRVAVAGLTRFSRAL